MRPRSAARKAATLAMYDGLGQRLRRQHGMTRKPWYARPGRYRPRRPPAGPPHQRRFVPPPEDEDLDE